eukprot:g1703.t1
MRLKNNIVRFNISILSNKIHSFDIATVGLTFFDTFGDDVMLTEDLHFYHKLIRILVQACSLSYLPRLSDFNYEGADEVEAFHFFRSHARQTILGIAISWNNVNAYKCLECMINILGETQSKEYAESVFYLMRDIDDACSAIDCGETLGQTVSDSLHVSVEADKTIELWNSLYVGIVSLSSFEQPMEMLRSIYELILKQSDTIICYFTKKTVVEDLIKFLIKELYYPPHEQAQLDCARSLCAILSNRKTSRMLNRRPRIDFVEDLLQFFIEKDTIHRQSVGRFTLKGRDVRGYVYCGLVSLLKHYYFDNMKDLSIIQSKSDHINIVIEYYKCIFSSMCETLKTLLHTGGNLTIFKEEMNLLCQVLSTMAFDLDLVEDDDYANVELIFRMEIFYTTFILNQLVPMVRAELLQFINSCAGNEIIILMFYATVIKLGGANIFKLNSIETVLMDTAGAFEHLLVSKKKDPDLLELVVTAQKDLVANCCRSFRFYKNADEIPQINTILARVYEFVWKINAYIMPILSNFIRHHDRGSSNNTTLQNLVPYVPTYRMYLKILCEFSNVVMEHRGSCQVDNLNQLLFGGLELSIILLEYVCVTCKCSYQRIQRDQLGRSIINAYTRIFEYCTKSSVNDDVLNMLNKKLDGTLNKVLQPLFWNELSAQVQNNLARMIHTIYSLSCTDANTDAIGNAVEFFALKNKTLGKIMSMHRMSDDRKVLSRRKFLRYIKKYTASLR